jgi:hypothetical protein
MARELEDMILDSDLPEHGLRRGDIGTGVLVHRGGEGRMEAGKEAKVEVGS